MTYSFFGLSKPAIAVSDALTRITKSYRSKNNGAISPLEPGGVYVPNLTTCANFASSRSMAVYMNLAELVKRSDIIFMFVADHTLKAFAKSMRRYNISGKIFCHFNPAFDADVLDFSSDNTYVSLLAPVKKKNGNLDFSSGLIMQGYGPGYEKLSEAFETLGININHLTSDEKCVYLGAVNMLTKITDYTQKSAMKLAKSVLGSDFIALDTFSRIYNLGEYELTSYDPVLSGDAQYIDNQRKLIKTMGFDDVSVLYASLLLLESRSDNPEISDKLREIAKNILKKY